MVHGVGSTGPIEGPNEPQKFDATQIIQWPALTPSRPVPRGEFSALKEANALIGIYRERFKSTT